MHPRPWYRSHLFWLGLPGLVFLLWGWLGSCRQDSGARWSDAAAGFSVSDSARTLSFRRFTDLSGSGLPNGAGLRGFSTWTWGDNRKHAELPWFPKALEFSREEVPLDYRAWTVSFAYWSLELLYLLFWTATLLVWQRRKSRLLKLHSAP